ncbi:MAG: YfiR family protein [Geobacteraceae bacterium]|nr:YfiR family protein [Geobacteraceae bacterium]NTW80864.1 YfiR family protein [Geobacteraceae bacterium]
MHRQTSLLRLGVGGLGAVLLFSLPVSGYEETSSGEYKLKAAFIFNFTKFVEWPGSAFRTKNELCIATLGRSPLDRELATLNGKVSQGRRIVFRQLNSPEEAAQCQVLFISRSELVRLESVLDSLGDLPVLTVSDSDEFCGKGGMLSLVNENVRIAFDVNIRAAHSAKLKPSSQLLKLARKIYGRP